MKYRITKFSNFNHFHVAVDLTRDDYRRFLLAGGIWSFMDIYEEWAYIKARSIHQILPQPRPDAPEATFFITIVDEGLGKLQSVVIRERNILKTYYQFLQL